MSIPHETPAVRICWYGYGQMGSRSVVREEAFTGVRLVAAWV